MWKFTKSQIEDFIVFRQKQLPEHYTILEETRMIDYYCCVLLPSLVKESTQKLTFVSYAAVLFKRFYMIKNIFEHQSFHQLLLMSNYLGMKLYGSQHTQIAKFVQIVKKKPKHQGYVHWGDELYAKYEMQLVQTLGYEIDVKPIYPIIVSVTQILQVRELLDNFLTLQFDKEVERYFLRALQGFTHVTYKESVIAISIVEAALRSICSELSLPNSQIVGPSTRPVKPSIQDRLKKLSQDHKETQKLIIEQLDAKFLDGHVKEVAELTTHLQETRDMPQENDKPWERYKQFKQKYFSQPVSVEFVEMKKQILNQ